MAFWREEFPRSRPRSLQSGAGGASQELRPTGLAGDWWPSGTWSGGLFYLNAFSTSGDRLWTVAPGATQLGAGVPVTQPDGCSPTSLSGIVAAGGKLFLPETFGFKVDLLNACAGAAGGMWTVDPSTGRLGAKMAAVFQFSYLLSDPQGEALYGLDPGTRPGKAPCASCASIRPAALRWPSTP